MLGYLVLFFIGKAFYNLAKKHDRNKWLFALLGVVVCYGMIFIGGLIIVSIVLAFAHDGIINSSNALLGMLGIPIGLISAWFFHYMLRKNWEGNPKNKGTDLLDTTDF